MAKPLVSVVIPAYNSRHLLERNLPSLMEAGMYEGRIVEILIVDDGSTDHTTEWLNDEYAWAKPVLRIVRHGDRQGFIRSVNHGVERAVGAYVLLLNTDVEVLGGAITALVARIESASDIFAVAPCVHNSHHGLLDGIYHAQTRPRFRLGHLSLYTHLGTLNVACPTLYACAGAGLFRRDAFRVLGGLDQLYAPLYCEDVDIAWRAWRSGFRTLYEPTAHMVHAHRGTVGRMYTQRELDIIGARNTLLLTWLNLTDPWLVFVHLLFLPAWVLAALCLRHPFAPAFWRACKMFPRVWYKRGIRSHRYPRYDDRTIFKALEHTMLTPRPTYHTYTPVKEAIPHG